MKLTREKRNYLVCLVVAMLFVSLFTATAYASTAGGNVSKAVDNAFNTYMKPQIMEIVNNVILIVVDAILAVIFIIKLVLSGMSYHKNGGQFEWHVPAILLAGLVVSLSAPLWIWSMIGWK